MTYAQLNTAKSLYQDIHARGSVESADRHQLIELLLNALIESMKLARRCIEHGNVPGKGTSVSRAIAMLGELRQSLDHSADAALSGRLDSLYDYVTRRLLQAQMNDDVSAVDESIELIAPIHEAWAGIREAYLAGQLAPA